MKCIISEMCRGCLNTSCTLTDQCFDAENNKNVLHIEKVNYCFRDIKVTEYESYKLCDYCCRALMVSYQFKKTLNYSNNRYNKYIKELTLNNTPKNLRFHTVTVPLSINIKNEVESDDTETNADRTRPNNCNDETFVVFKQEKFEFEVDEVTLEDTELRFEETTVNIPYKEEPDVQLTATTKRTIDKSNESSDVDGSSKRSRLPSDVLGSCVETKLNFGTATTAPDAKPENLIDASKTAVSDDTVDPNEPIKRHSWSKLLSNLQSAPPRKRGTYTKILPKPNQHDNAKPSQYNAVASTAKPQQSTCPEVRKVSVPFSYNRTSAKTPMRASQSQSSTVPDIRNVTVPFGFNQLAANNAASASHSQSSTVPVPFSFNQLNANGTVSNAQPRASTVPDIRNVSVPFGFNRLGMNSGVSVSQSQPSVCPDIRNVTVPYGYNQLGASNAMLPVQDDRAVTAFNQQSINSLVFQSQQNSVHSNYTLGQNIASLGACTSSNYINGATTPQVIYTPVSQMNPTASYNMPIIFITAPNSSATSMITNNTGTNIITHNSTDATSSPSYYFVKPTLRELQPAPGIIDKKVKSSILIHSPSVANVPAATNTPKLYMPIASNGKHNKGDTNKKEYATTKVSRSTGATSSVDVSNTAGRSHHVDVAGDFRCLRCSKRFVNSERLEKHKKRHFTNGLFRCIHCYEEFHFEFEAITHEMAIHSKNELLKCHFCDKRFKLYHNLKLHEKSHIKKLDAAAAANAGDKIVQCDFIEGSSSPYKCVYCPTCFTSSRELFVHIRDYHFKPKNMPVGWQ